jgi:hypothetical protein
MKMNTVKNTPLLTLDCEASWDMMQMKGWVQDEIF